MWSIRPELAVQALLAIVHSTPVGYQELERKDQVEVSDEGQYLPGRLEARGL